MYRLIGLVSFGGRGCAIPLRPGFYASVYPQLDWVKRVIEETITCPHQDPKCENCLAKCKATVGKEVCLRASILLSIISCFQKLRLT